MLAKAEVGPGKVNALIAILLAISYSTDALFGMLG
jgi:hypothetical protein